MLENAAVDGSFSMNGWFMVDDGSRWCLMMLHSLIVDDGSMMAVHNGMA